MYNKFLVYKNALLETIVYVWWKGITLIFDETITFIIKIYNLKKKITIKN